MDDRDGLRVIDSPSSSSDMDGQTNESELTASANARPEATVHGVVLAAGTSSRYGDRNKLLEPIDGTPMIVHATRTLLSADVDGVSVVVGHEADRLRDTLDGLTVGVRTNDAYEEGQSTSVATGVEVARRRNADAILLALGDMPDVDSATVDLIVETYRRGTWDAVAAAYEGKRGNPVLFDSGYFDALADVEGDVGGREILVSDPDAVAVETGDPGVHYDVDRRADR